MHDLSSFDYVYLGPQDRDSQSPFLMQMPPIGTVELFSENSFTGESFKINLQSVMN